MPMATVRNYIAKMKTKKATKGLKAFLDRHYYSKKQEEAGRIAKDEASRQSYESFDGLILPPSPPSTSIPPPAAPAIAPSSQESAMFALDEPFSATLLRLIDSKGKTDVEVYKRANLDRKLFSKIRKGGGYMPSKKTIVALAIALELSLPEASDLLRQAGFALSRSVLFDVIMEYFFTARMYDIYVINNLLLEYDQPLLGG